MSRQLPPLDLHAHISPKANSAELERLGAVVFAATRSLEEYQRVQNRRDQVTVWGVGCHPGVPEAQNTYNPVEFAALVSSTAYVSEVGLDGRSKVPMATQENVLCSILTQVQKTPRILSIHSSGATERALDALEKNKVKGAVLHWWRGSETQTRRALALDCRFSVNAANMKHANDLALIPLERLLVETDHPFGDRPSSSQRQPGAITDVETALARLHGTTAEKIRQQVWVNFADLVDEVGVLSMLPKPIQRMISAAK